MRNNKMDKYYIREKIYSDKNLEKKIKEEVENYLVLMLGLI